MSESVNWQELEDKNDFLAWMITVTVKTDFEKLSEATDHFKNIKITMQMNGIEIKDPVSWIRRVEEHMKSAIESAARELVEEKVNDDFNDLQDILDRAKRSILDKFPRDEDDW